MRVTNFLGMPERIHKVWTWIVAIDAFDYCSPGKLAGLVESEPIPEELRPVIASIITGERRPNPKKAARLKLPADQRMVIAGEVSTILGLIDVFKYSAIDSSVSSERGAAMLAEREGIETIDMVRELEAEARAAINETAEHHGVSPETIENILRQFRQKIENYPNV